MYYILFIYIFFIYFLNILPECSKTLSFKGFELQRLFIYLLAQYSVISSIPVFIPEWDYS